MKQLKLNKRIFNQALIGIGLSVLFIVLPPLLANPLGPLITPLAPTQEDEKAMFVGAIFFWIIMFNLFGISGLIVLVSLIKKRFALLVSYLITTLVAFLILYN